MPFGSQSAFDTYARNIHTAARSVFSISRSKLNEALSCGYGFRTYASLRAALKQAPLSDATTFDHAVFQSTLAALEDWSKIPVVAVLVEGNAFDIEIEKWPSGPGQRNGPRDLDVSYHIVMNVSNADGQVVQGGQPFTLPVFAETAHDEKFRVDSGHGYRVTDGHSVTRFRKGTQTLRTSLRDGRWGGEAFIYSSAEQQDDLLTLGTIKSAMVRSVLPTTSNRVVCGIYRPDHYDENARRIEITLGTPVLDFLGSSPFHFEIPKMEKRFFVMDDGRSNTEGVGVIVNGSWGAAVNSNGIDEADNPSSLDEVRVRMQIAVEERLSLLGFNSNRR